MPPVPRPGEARLAHHPLGSAVGVFSSSDRDPDPGTACRMLPGVPTDGPGGRPGECPDRRHGCSGENIGAKDRLAAKRLPQSSSSHGGPCRGRSQNDAETGTFRYPSPGCSFETQREQRQGLQGVHADEVGDAQVAVHGVPSQEGDTTARGRPRRRNASHRPAGSSRPAERESAGPWRSRQ